MNGLSGDWHWALAEPWASVALMAMAVLCGAVIGAEREKKFKPAGLRTMILIGMGSAAFTMMSFALAGPGGDRGRVAAQIVSGIGFLGAGAILHGGSGVRGLTTAATIWAMAAVGMTVGAGYAAAGLGLTLTVLAALIGAAILENRYLGPCAYRKVVLVHDADGKTAVWIDALLDDYQIPPDARQVRRREDGSVELTLTYCNAHKHHKEFLVKLADFPEVRAIDLAGN
jgi:putative Mg2+ transporter-C (MgtC) family protein